MIGSFAPPKMLQYLDPDPRRTLVATLRTVFRMVFLRHPILAAWAVLAVGMVVMLLYAAKDVALLPGQMAALIIATFLLAGACVWILTWE